VGLMYKYSCYLQNREVFPDEKWTVAIRMLTFGAPTDQVDEYLGMDESICLDVMYHFSEVVVKVLRKENLRQPNIHG
jgi:hypothetical protein